MNQLQRTGIALTSALLSLAGPALAGDETKTPTGYATVKKGECACDVCALYMANVDTLVDKVTTGNVPAKFCEGSCPIEVAWLRAHPAKLFAKAVGARPDEIASMLESVKTRFTDKVTTDEQRARLLDVIAFFPKHANEKVTLALWRTAPTAFATDHLTVFATYGCEPLAAELRERAKGDVLAAAYFGVRGDDCGKKTLQTAFRKLDLAQGVIAEPALAALGLAGLGEDKPLQRLQVMLRDAALAALDAGRVDDAKRAALSAELIGKLARAPGKAELGWLSASLDWHCSTRGAELANADEVFKVIEGLHS